jgi:iron complex outermembrane receptor protein
VLASGQEGEARRLEEVIVSAQKKTESAQTTPISLVVFNAEALEKLGISNISDIRAQVPNFLVDQFPFSNQTLRLFIRGVGLDDVQVTQDPAVGVYLNGVYLSRSTGLASDVADLERIEVLRGPQGTLYGRNTTGGALNLITSKPTPEAVAFSQILGGGNRSRLRSKTSLNLPLGEKQAIKLAALIDRLDGFVDNSGPGGNFGDRKSEAYRLDWRWQPTQATTVDYSYDKSRIESYNYTPQAVAPGIPTGGLEDAAILSTQRFVDYSDQRFSKMATSVPLLPVDTDIDGHALTLEWATEGLTLRSISAWRELSDISYIDFASGASSEYRLDFQSIVVGDSTTDPLSFDAVRTRIEQEQLSQELQVLGNINERWEYVAGLYYFKEKARENWLPLHHISSFPLIETGDEAYVVTLRTEDNKVKNEALAAYGQLTWTPAVVDSRLHFSLGWRHSRDEREVERIFHQESHLDFSDQVIGPVDVIDFTADANKSFDDDSFSFMVEYDWTADFHAYGKYVEAYKSGGFNTRDPDPEFFEQGFDEEKNRTVELGFKGELLDNQLRVNGSVFYSRFSDYQLNILLPGGISDTRVFNSGEAQLSGFEMDLTAFPWYGLICSLSYAYLHSEIEDITDPFSGAPRSLSFVNAPRNTAALNIDYHLPPFTFGQLSLNMNYNYVDAREPNNELLHRDAYDLLNARVSLSELNTKIGRFTASAWVKNALDDDYVVFSFENLPHASRAVHWGEPRTWGIDLKYEI